MTDSSTQSNSSQATAPQSTTSISDTAIAKISALAARQVTGVHALSQPGKLNALREYVPGSNKQINTQGVEVEVTTKDVTVDLTVVAEFGYNLKDLASVVRKNVTESISNLTSLDVAEVNVDIIDINFPESASTEPADATSDSKPESASTEDSEQ